MKKNEVRFKLVSTIISLRLLKRSTKIPITFYGELQEASRAIQLDAKKGIMKACLKRMSKWEELFKETFPSEEHLLNRLTTVANIETDPAKVYLAKLLLEDLLTNKANFTLADTVYRNAFKVTKEIA